MAIEHILVPIDFSDCAPRTAESMIRFAAEVGAKVTLLYVVPLPVPSATPFQPDGADPTTVGRYLQQSGEARMDALVARYGRQPVTVEGRVVEGPVVESIVATADALDVDMIAMGTHGRRGLARFVLGSVAEQVTRRTERQVHLVHTQHHEGCEARSCAWCKTHVLPEQETVLQELEG